MDQITGIYSWCVANWDSIAKVVAYVIAGATVIVKLTPTLRDDTILKTIVKFLGKYIALNR